MKNIIILLIIIASTVTMSAQASHAQSVRWSAPMEAYPNQWTPSAPPAQYIQPGLGQQVTASAAYGNQLAYPGQYGQGGHAIGAAQTHAARATAAAQAEVSGNPYFYDSWR